MGRLLLLVFLGGCGAPASVEISPSRKDNPPHQPVPSAEVELPTPITARPAKFDEIVFLTISPWGQIKATRNDEVENLDTQRQLKGYLDRLTKHLQSKTVQAGEKWEKPEATLILRIDKRTPFATSYPIMKACWIAGFTNVQLRAIRWVEDTPKDPFDLSPPFEGGPPTPASPAIRQPPGTLTLTVTAAMQGTMNHVTLRKEGMQPAREIQADMTTIAKEFKELATKHKDKLPKLRLEIGDDLHQEHVIWIFDAAVQAGFTDIAPVPIDPAKR